MTDNKCQHQSLKSMIWSCYTEGIYGPKDSVGNSMINYTDRSKSSKQEATNDGVVQNYQQHGKYTRHLMSPCLIHIDEKQQKEIFRRQRQTMRDGHPKALQPVDQWTMITENTSIQLNGKDSRIKRKLGNHTNTWQKLRPI